MKRWIVRISAALLALVLIVAVVGVVVLRSQWFLDYLRTQIVQQAQRATGATVEIGALRLDWSTLRVSVDRFVLHGKEAPGEPPFVQVNSATLGLRIISILQRKADLQSLRIEAPQIRVVVYPDGTTNIPGARALPQTLWTQDLLNLKVGEYQIDDGTLTYDDRNIPLNVQGRNLQARLNYIAATPAYHATFASDSIRIAPPGYAPVESTIDTEFTLEENRVQFSRLRLTAPNTTVGLSGTLDDMRNPRGTLALRASTAMRELVREFKLPVDPSGTAAFDGNVTVSFENGFEYRATGNLSARGLRFAQDQIHIEGANLSAQADVSKAGAILRSVRLQALGATVNGEVNLPEWREASVKGTLSGLNLRRAANLWTSRDVPWDGTLSGPFTANVTFGQSNLVAKTTLTIAPASDGDPIRGHIDVDYDQARGTLALGSSSVETAATRVELEGTLGRTLRVRARTTRLEDLLPAIAFAQGSEPADLTLKLNNGSITVDGTVTGDLKNPQFHGQISVANGQVRDYSFDQFSTEIDANQREISARNITASRGRTTVTGTAALALRSGDGGSFTNSEIVAQLNVQNVDIAEVARLAGATQPLSGTASANIKASGTIQQPEATITLDVQNPAAVGEKADRLRLEVRYSPTTIEVANGIVNDATSEVRFSGAYKHPAGDLRTGDVTFDASTPNFPLARIENVAKLDPKVEAVLNGRIQGSGKLDRNGFALTAATANLATQQIVIDGEAIGSATLQAETRGTNLALTASGNVRESRVDLSGSWSLQGDSPGMANVRFSRVNIESLRDLATRERISTPLSLEGFIEGDATVDVALRKPEDFKAQIHLSSIQVNPRQNPSSTLGLKPEDVILKNSEPVVVDVTAKEAMVRSAHFTGRNTQIDITGMIPFEAQSGADLSVRGSVDLAILQLMEPGLQANGTATISASVRGSLKDPNVNGQLSLENAQAYLGDLPNGIDHASGTVLFDRRRATLQGLTAETGGGQVKFTGFVEFAQPLQYNLQAEVRNVRVRYPQDVSTTFDGDLVLKGTSANSLLSGNVALKRSAFSLSTDLGEILARSSQPVPTPDSESDYLNGMNLRVRIQNSPNFQVETSVATNIDAEVDLNLRGTPSRPVLQGLISVNRGEAQVFGNSYTVDRADIRFTNPVKIEPTFDVVLTTRARGVNVSINVSGTPTRPNLSYSSDPPLQSGEIIALLAVGRDPTTAASQLAPGVPGSSANTFLQASGSLLGQAATAQVTNRLQRFFGSSRVQIDPTLTGVDNLPQARLTFNQQVSKDILLTYITNLNRTQDQIVRFQWDFSREWSMVAVRDPSGLVGFDVQFRKRFK